MPKCFDYAVVRIVPRVEREEFLNAGVILFCPEEPFLGARVHLHEAKLSVLCPETDVDLVKRRLAGMLAVCLGDPAAGPVARLGIRERFHWVGQPQEHDSANVAGAYRHLRFSGRDVGAFVQGIVLVTFGGVRVEMGVGATGTARVRGKKT